jgi:hypothetical protein
MLALRCLNGRTRVRVQATLIHALLISMGFLCAGVASSATQVFHSQGDDGIPGSSTVAEGGVQSVYLYIDGGAVASAPGSACYDGQGDEICGYELTLTGLFGLTFAGFNPEPSADVMVNLAADSIAIGGLDTETPPSGPVRIGELLVNAVAGGEVELTSGEAIDADLSSEVLASGTVVTVPEPVELLLLCSGMLLLGVLDRRRRRR